MPLHVSQLVPTPSHGHFVHYLYQAGRPLFPHLPSFFSLPTSSPQTPGNSNPISSYTRMHKPSHLADHTPCCSSSHQQPFLLDAHQHCHQYMPAFSQQSQLPRHRRMSLQASQCDERDLARSQTPHCRKATHRAGLGVSSVFNGPYASPNYAPTRFPTCSHPFPWPLRS